MIKVMAALIRISLAKWPLNIEPVMFILQLCRFPFSGSLWHSQCFYEIQFSNLSHAANASQLILKLLISNYFLFLELQKTIFSSSKNIKIHLRKFNSPSINGKDILTSRPVTPENTSPQVASLRCIENIKIIQAVSILLTELQMLISRSFLVQICWNFKLKLLIYEHFID